MIGPRDLCKRIVPFRSDDVRVSCARGRQYGSAYGDPYQIIVLLEIDLRAAGICSDGQTSTTETPRLR